MLLSTHALAKTYRVFDILPKTLAGILFGVTSGLTILCRPPIVEADVILGDLSFTTLISSAPGSPGVNDFEIDNPSGPFAFPSDFPVTTDLSFDNASLILTLTDGTNQKVALSDIGPGLSTSPSLQFSSSFNFKSANFVATQPDELDNLRRINVYGITNHLEAFLKPATSSLFTPNADYVLMGVNTATTKPEPARYRSYPPESFSAFLDEDLPHPSVRGS